MIAFFLELAADCGPRLGGPGALGWHIRGMTRRHERVIHKKIAQIAFSGNFSPLCKN
jgi:hypothetical protein